YTNRAIFSILTSLYPVAGRNNYLQNPPGRYEGPSLMSSLAGAGYATSVYSGDPLSFENDEYLYRELGIQRFVYGSQRVKGHNDSEPWQETAKKDYAALKLLKHDIAAFAAANQRYAALYVPLISHGPWPDISAEENVSEVNKRGRNLLRLQDGWLGEIAEHLTALGTLNRTLIVFAADHGLRTKKDDPAFSGSRLEKKSFHVPLLIFAPGIGADQASIPYLSSHIDIAPTLLDLLGQPRQREFEQGLPLWDKRIAERTTFFLGRHYFGIDGYHRSGSFAMWNIALRMAEESAAFEFGGRGAALPPAPRYAEISGAIQDIVAVQQLVLARFASRRSL
ncbi:MAG TPA: sulfatase-like hydrolase/transferase, partial [Oligoflexia bacterium]|nr:sulfatase-like hydrolase/transferase [Oligoflexia bacterium]